MKIEPKEKFIQLALKHADEMESGSVSKANKISDRIRKICKVQCESEDKGNLFFSDLVVHDQPAVRLWSATFLYLTNPERAISEFQRLKDVQSPQIRMSASSSLWWIDRGQFKIEFD